MNRSPLPGLWVSFMVWFGGSSILASLIWHPLAWIPAAVVGVYSLIMFNKVDRRVIEQRRKLAQVR